MRILSRISVFAMTLALAACGGAQPGDEAAIAACKSRSSAAVGGPFHLTAHNGAPTTEANFKGRKALVFFGYTYCPDICPVVLFNVGKALEDVPEAKRPVTIFISVDPARDTPETITQYIASNGFPKDIVGLTGIESRRWVAPFALANREEDYRTAWEHFDLKAQAEKAVAG